MNTLNPQQLNLLQYTHLEKLYGYFPGMNGATLAALYGLDEASYREARAQFDTNAKKAAQELLADSAFAEQVKRLPFRAGQTILAIGDSMTDDLQSWLEILRHLLAETRAQDDIKVINGGLSAHTSAMILRRFVPTLSQKPDWIFCLLGGNDVTRIGSETNKPQVSLEETKLNLLTMRRLAAEMTKATWVWLTPPPFDEERAKSFPPFKMGGSIWRNADVLVIGEFMRHQPEIVVDLQSIFGVPVKPGLQGFDGVHPSLEGQQTIAKAVAERLVWHKSPR
jgi:acyl-CoA thioesterase I